MPHGRPCDLSECRAWVAADRLVLDVKLAKEDLVEPALDRGRGTNVGLVAVDREIECTREVRLDKCLMILGLGDLRRNRVKLTANPLLLDSEKFERDGSRVMRLEELRALAEEPRASLAKCSRPLIRARSS